MTIKLMLMHVHARGTRGIYSYKIFERREGDGSIVWECVIYLRDNEVDSEIFRCLSQARDWGNEQIERPYELDERDYEDECAAHEHAEFCRNAYGDD